MRRRRRRLTARVATANHDDIILGFHLEDPTGASVRN